MSRAKYMGIKYVTNMLRNNFRKTQSYIYFVT